MFILSYVLVFLRLIASGSTSGIFELSLVDFNNPENLMIDGSCCDEEGYYLFSSCGVCDHTFNLCVSTDPRSSAMTDCDMGSWNSPAISSAYINFTDTTIGVTNPLIFPFDRWPMVIKVKIDVWDEDDAESRSEIIEQYTSDVWDDKPKTKFIQATDYPLELVGTRTSLNLIARVYCDNFYFGRTCSVYCAPRNDETGHYWCNPQTGTKICRKGWSGENCTVNYDDCLGNRCSSGSTCVDYLGYYICLCPPGKTGTVCDAEVDECVPDICQNGATCHDRRGDFMCECTRGFVGKTCGDRTVPCRGIECVHGFCIVSRDGSESCVCQEGYMGPQCRDYISGCQDNPCGENAENCTDLGYYSFNCTCKHGFAGTKCDRQLKECELRPCQNMGECNDRGYCECLEGFEGHHCEYESDECFYSPCQNGGVCVDRHLSYECECPLFASGPDCETRLDHCFSEPCMNGATCVDIRGDFRCICAPGFQGHTCSDLTDLQ